MPLRYSDSAPGDAVPVVTGHVGRLLSQNPNSVALQGLTTGGLSAGECYRTYRVDLDRLASGELLAAARPGAWRCLLRQEGEAIAEADLSADATGASRVVAVHRGPAAAATERALRSSAVTEAVGQGDYEARLIEAPGIYFIALWLAGQGGDLLVPIEPDRSSLPLYQPVSEQQALQVLRQRAAETLERHAAMPGAGS